MLATCHDQLIIFYSRFFLESYRSSQDEYTPGRLHVALYSARLRASQEAYMAEIARMDSAIGMCYQAASVWFSVGSEGLIFRGKRRYTLCGCCRARLSSSGHSTGQESKPMGSASYP